jgi:manganese/zinc/iron transport system substrate-binding protein
MKRSIKALALFSITTLAALLLSACGPQSAPETGGEAGAETREYPYQAAATVGMITDIVRNVAGEQAVVEGIIGEGVDPHMYKPTRNDVITLREADIIFYNGLMLEGKMGDVLVRVANRGNPVHAVTEELLASGDYVMSDAEQHYDPHVWMDVEGWRKAVAVVAEALSGFDPANAEVYRQNAEDYSAKLEELDAYAARVIGSIPEKQRVLVTAHDAFSYLGRAYGLEVRGIQGLSTESEAGVRDIEELVSFLVENQIPAVFVETSVADKNVRALVEGAKAQGHDLRIGGELFSDAMGQPGTYEGTYIGMIDHNVTTIARALGGDAPEGGFQEKLGSREEG